MVAHKSIALCFLLFALSGQMVSANWLQDHLHKKMTAKAPAVEVPTAVRESGVRESGVRMEAAAAPQMPTGGKKDQVRIKELLGMMTGPTTAAQVPAGCSSAFDLLASSGEFTFLVNAIKATGLESITADPALVATVLAPSDKAFTASLAELGVSPAQLFADPITLTIVIKYHVIPGLSLQTGDWKDSQPYVTLLTDKKLNAYTVQYDYAKKIDLKELKGEDRDMVASAVEAIIPSGGDKAKINSSKNLNAGCPTALYAIGNVLIPAYKDLEYVPLINNAVTNAENYVAAGGNLTALGVVKP